MTGSQRAKDPAHSEDSIHPLRAFLSELALHPRQMGTVWPSSRTLARAMVRRLPADNGLPILELGPGTGVVTQALIESGLPPQRLVAVEKSPRLVDILQQRFPGARIVEGDALELEAILPGQQFAAVLSSLPLKVFSAPEVARLAGNIRNVLHPTGRWIQYTYQVFNGHPPTTAFERTASDLVWMNLPPALVCVYQPTRSA